MQVIETTIPDVKIIEPKVFGDERGFFFESFNLKTFQEKAQIFDDFVQDQPLPLTEKRLTRTALPNS